MKYKLNLAAAGIGTFINQLFAQIWMLLSAARTGTYTYDFTSGNFTTEGAWI